MLKPQVGESVVYCDSKGVDHMALITIGWSETCVNLVYVSGDENDKDTYGRQIKRETSVQHVSSPVAHGNYFRYLTDQRKDYQPPVSS